MTQKKLRKKAARIFTETGCAIRGEKVTAQFRKMTRKKIVTGTSTHKIQQAGLEGTVYCVIDRPLNYLGESNQKGASGPNTTIT